MRRGAPAKTCCSRRTHCYLPAVSDVLPEKPQPKRKRKWLRRVGYTLLALLLVLVIFHRPILIAVIHTVAVKVAAKQHIELSLDVEGTVLTNLSLKNIHARPSGTGPSPVSRISIDEVTARYSLPSLIRRGPQEFLKSYTLRNADIEVKPVEGTKEQKRDLASTLHGIIQQPALFSDRVTIENLSLVAHVPDGDFALRGVTIRLDPVETGVVQIARLEIPKVRTWENLQGTTTYANRDLVIRDLALDPQIVIRRFELDASQRGKGINRIEAEGTFFGGSAQFSMLVRELGKKKAEVKIESHVTDFSLAKVSAYFKPDGKSPAIGTINQSNLWLTGDPNVPASWTGSLTATAGPLQAGGVTIDEIGARLDAKNGTALLNVNLRTQGNHVDAVANCALPRTLDGFRGTEVDGTLTVAAEELSQLAEQLTHGGVTGSGVFALRDKTLTASLNARAREIEGPKFSIVSGTAQVEVSKTLAAPEEKTPPFDGMRSRVTATFTEARAANYAVDAGVLELSSRGETVELAKLELVRVKMRFAPAGLTRCRRT